MGFALDRLGPDRCRRIAEELFDRPRIDEGRSEVIGRCPLPGHEDAKPSAAYNWSKDLFNCLGCGASGDLVKLWGEINGIPDQAGALKAFKAEFSIEDDSGRASGSSRRSKAKTKPQSKPGPFVPEDEFSALPTLPDAWIQRLRTNRGWSEEVISALDLRLWTADRGRESRAAIPIRDDQGRLVNIRLYGSGLEPKIKSFWTGSKSRGDFQSYGKVRLWLPGYQPGREDEPLWLCEGEPDCVCALSQGLQAATVTGGAGSLPREALELLAGRDVVIAYDADRKGHRGGMKVARKLAVQARLVRMITWPRLMLDEGELPDNHGQDLTDWFIRHGQSRADLLELLAQAREIQAPREIANTSGPGRFFVGRHDGKRGTFMPRLVADEILSENDYKTDSTTKITYRWTGQVWQEFDTERIHNLALRKLDLESTKARAVDVAAQVIDLSLAEPGEEFNANPDLLCLANGTYNLVIQEFGPFNQADLLTNQLAVDWVEGEPPFSCWENFLDEVIGNQDVISELQEFFGYCLTRSTRYAKALLLVGPGSDGKSTLLNVLQALVGQANCSAVDLASLENEFHRASLVNKQLNVFTEVEAGAFSSQYFKAIVSGDLISASFKHRDVFEFRPWSKLAFSANDWPRVTDNSWGFFRRVLPIEHVKQFKGRDIDPHMTEKLLAELPAILKWALNGLRRLRERGRFEASEATQTLLSRYQTDNNPLSRFLDEKTDSESSSFQTVVQVPKDDLYTAYSTWCKANGCFPMGDSSFGRELRKLRPEIEQTRPRVSNGKRIYAWRGLRLLSPEEGGYKTSSPTPPPDQELPI